MQMLIFALTVVQLGTGDDNQGETYKAEKEREGKREGENGVCKINFSLPGR